MYVVPQMAEGTVTDLFFPGDTVFVMPADTPNSLTLVLRTLAEDTVRIFGYNTLRNCTAWHKSKGCGAEISAAICNCLPYLPRPSDISTFIQRLNTMPVPRTAAAWIRRSRRWRWR